MFGIKNAGRSAGQDKLVVGGGVNQLLAGRLSAGWVMTTCPLATM